jgi:putative acetyltransferase
MSTRSDPARVRRERPDDFPAVRRVNEAAFGRAAEADLVDALRDHGKATLSLVAVLQDRVVGHILFSRSRSSPATR